MKVIWLLILLLLVTGCEAVPAPQPPVTWLELNDAILNGQPVSKEALDLWYEGALKK
jgi:hypothetical protein